MTILSLSILVLAFLGAFRPRSERPFGVKAIKAILIFSIIAIFSLLVYFSYRQYIAWQAVEPSKFLLPPYQGINYFLGYIGARIFAPYLISLAAAILFLFSARKLNKKYEERFFEAEEPWFGALAIFLTGWPALLFYFIGLITFYFLLSTFYFLCYGKETRVSLYSWWIPLAIIVIIINTYLIRLGIWKLLKV